VKKQIDQMNLDNVAKSSGVEVGHELPDHVLDNLLEAAQVEIERIVRLPSRLERSSAVAAFASGPLRAGLVQGWRRREAQVEGLLMLLSGGPGLSEAAGRIRSALKAEAKAAAMSLRVLSRDDAAARAEYTATIGGREVTVAVPDGWACSDEGVSQLVRARESVEERSVTYAPIILSRHLGEYGTPSAWVELAWPSRTPGRWTVQRVSRGTITSSRELVGLGAVGAPVNSSNSDGVIRWLAALEAANPRLQSGYVSTRLGWQGKGCTHFLAGSRLIAPEKHVEIELLVEDDPGLEQVAACTRPSGSWEGWLAAVAPLHDRPIAWLTLYAAAATPLLRLLEVPNFILDIHGTSGHGKTSVLRLGASVWGEPEDGRYIRSWQATVSKLERDAATLTDLPLALDESNRVPIKERPSLAQAVYMLGNGSGKGRATIKGTQRIAEWRTIVLSTGEASITSYTEDEGTRGRCLPLYGGPLAGAAQAEKLREGLRRHHGHLGPRLVESLVAGGDRLREQLRVRYAEALDAASSGTPSPMARRLATYVAVLMVAADLVHGLGVARPSIDPWLYLREQIDGAAAGADRPVSALRELVLWALPQTSRIATWGGRKPPMGADSISSEAPQGWLGRVECVEDWTWLALTMPIVEHHLRQRGHEPHAIIRQWAERGLLSRQSEHLSVPVKLPGQTVSQRMYRFDRSVLEQIGAIER
jgi:hypothetical protein